MSHPSNSSNRSDSVRHVSDRRPPVRSGKKRFNKKRFWLLIAILAVVEALAFCLAMQWKYLFPSHAVSELYAHYADVEGIEASFIKDYRVNDSVFVDVTVLEATNTDSWDMIAKKLNVPPPTVIPDEYKELFAQSNSVGSFVVNKNSVDPSHPGSFIQDVYIFSREKMVISVFHDCYYMQTTAILNKKIIEIRNN